MILHRVMISILIGTLSMSAHAQTVSRGEVEQAITTILSFPHGLYRLSPQDKSLLAQVKANPTPYVQALMQRYSPSVIAALEKGSQDSIRFERAILLLNYIGEAEAMQLLVQWYSRLDQLVIERGEETNVLLLRRMILNALPAVKHELIVTKLLSEMDRLDPATTLAALDYLARAAKGDPVLIDQLNEAEKNQKLSPFQRKRLRRLIQVLEK